MRIIPIRRLLFQAGVLGGLLVLLAACGTISSGQPISSSGTPQGTTTATSQAALPSPTLSPGPQTCPTTVNNLAYWNSLVPTQPGVSSVESVTCGYLTNAPALQALVTVRYKGSGSVLDVYVYDNLTDATPTQIFKLQNLYMGEARISAEDTLMTAEVDRASGPNHNQSDATYTRDLFREFKWSPGAHTLVQIIFPGIFPDLTRYQAEEDQAQVDQGHQTWKLSATRVAQALGASLLHWEANAPATLLSGGGANDTQAVVRLTNRKQMANSVTLNMARLAGNAKNGIWIVTNVETAGLSITQPQSGSIIHGVTTVTGAGSAFEGVIGHVLILDHLYADIGHATAHGAVGNGNTTFSTTITTHPTFTNGAQEGLVMLTETSNATGEIAGAVIVKVLIQP